MYDKLIEQINIEKNVCTEKLATAHIIIEEVKVKSENLNRNKPEESSIEEIENKLKDLKNKDHIEEMNKLISEYVANNRLTKAWVEVIKEKAGDLIYEEEGMEYSVPNSINENINSYTQELLG